ncbi:MAG: 5'/3'-nucleotidase SurE [Coriobacteriales bacterium]
MDVLVVNDDGIDAPGIRELAALARTLGRVFVVAPREVQSGASHRVSLSWPLRVERRDDVPGAEAAYAVAGSPADCVSLALGCLLPDRPGLVLSGINAGFNVGFDVAYSGTVAAAMEAAMRGVPAVAFSQTKVAADYSLARGCFPRVMDELLSRPARTDGVWNVNIPGCGAGHARGVLFDRSTAAADLRPILGAERVELGESGAGGQGRPDGAPRVAAGEDAPAAGEGAHERGAGGFGVRMLVGPVDVEANARDVSSDIGAVCADYVSVSWVRGPIG